MDDQTNADGLGSAEGEAGSQKKRGVSADNEPGALRLKLPASLSARVRETIAELRSREVTLSPEELMEKFLVSVPDSYWEEQVLQRTPEEFYIKAAILIPELREKLARQARKALVNRPTSAHEGKPKARKKRAVEQSKGETGVSEQHQQEVTA